MTERLQAIREKVDFVEYWEGYYLSSSDVQWLIAQAEKVEKYEKAIEAELKGATKILIKKLVEEN